MRVLLVEDEIYLSEAISYLLRKNNYTVDVSSDGNSGLDNGLSGIYDVIILDIMLPFINGLEIIKELRANNITTPVIMLSAKNDVETKIDGLDYGADDYLSKPFETKELLARLRALLRRKEKVLMIDKLNYKDLYLDTNSLILSCGENEFKLTLKESQLMELFITNVNNTLSKNTIIEKLWGFVSDAADNNVEVYISFLRKKMNSLKTRVKIVTIRNLGYVLKEE